MMKTIHILSPTQRGDTRLFIPLQQHEQELKEQGLRFRFFESLEDPELLECDALAVKSHFFKDASWWQEQHEALIGHLLRFREQVSQVLYIDVSDSTSVLHASILPYVDAYYKAFLLRDRSQYAKHFYSGRIFSDYYHHHFGVEDQNPRPESLSSVITKKEELQKLKLLWNPGVAFEFGRWHRFLVNQPLVKWAKQLSPKTRVTCRLGMNYRESIAYQRVKMQELLVERKVPTQVIPFRRYLLEMATAHIAISPFGWGEFAFRDYECFFSHCLLLKPSMEHLETWPNYYIPQNTYIPLAWDFSDFHEVLDHYCQQRQEARAIAKRAHEHFMKNNLHSKVFDKEAFLQRVVQIFG